jgi:hypothetical protein
VLRSHRSAAGPSCNATNQHQQLASAIVPNCCLLVARGSSSQQEAGHAAVYNADTNTHAVDVAPWSCTNTQPVSRGGSKEVTGHCSHNYAHTQHVRVTRSTVSTSHPQPATSALQPRLHSIVLHIVTRKPQSHTPAACHTSTAAEAAPQFSQPKSFR